MHINIYPIPDCCDESHIIFLKLTEKVAFTAHSRGFENTYRFIYLGKGFTKFKTI